VAAEVVMFQLRLLTGKTAGAEIGVCRFPFWIGRGVRDHLRVEADGVWERHLELRILDRGVALESRPEARTHINGQRVARALLRNGDLIEIGSQKLQFWLAPVRQHGLLLREITTWLALVALVALQVVLLTHLAE
jgi:pSer/pThr/pTyr-binding forkhead associated (FHA) protein